jgi:hypothetical protein
MKTRIPYTTIVTKGSVFVAKKYHVSEAALRKLIKQIVAEEVGKQQHQAAEPFEDEFQEEPWFSLGEPQAIKAPKSNNASQFEQEFPGWNEQFHPEFNELDNPPFLNNRKKK